MGALNAPQMGSPVQSHTIHVATDLLWITGDMESLGNPHYYINQDNIDFLRINNPHLVPWNFTGIPASHAPLIITARERIQMLIFTEESSLEGFRTPPNTEKLLLHFSLAIIRGAIPFLGEAKIHNFLDFWKGLFFPIIDAEIYYLAGSAASLPRKVPMVYANRALLQSYINA